MREFEKGEYVVLLEYPGGNARWTSMPLNHIYKLNRDSHFLNFSFEKDIDGKDNGWSISENHPDVKNYSSLRFRKANSWEIDEYDKFDKPCKVIENYKLKNYNYLIKLFKKLNIK